MGEGMSQEPEGLRDWGAKLADQQRGAPPMGVRAGRDDHTVDALPYYATTNGRRSGKTAAMLRYMAKANPGLHAVLGPNRLRLIDNQGDALVVEDPSPLLPGSEGPSSGPEPASGEGA